MRVCVVSFKECWQDATGCWFSYGGFPLQMAALASLFDAISLVVVRGRPRPGGMPLPVGTVVALRSPVGVDGRRKLSVLARLPYYLGAIGWHIRHADVVHVPLPGDLPFLGMLAAVTLRKRLLARYGGSWLPTSETTFMNRVTRECMRRWASERNLMLATGTGSEPPGPGIEWLFATAISERELDVVRPDLSRPPGRPLRLAYVGRLSPEKGVAHLLGAVNLLRSDTPPEEMPQLTVIGGGPEEDRLRHLVTRSGCAPYVRFVGQLTRGDVVRELLRTDVCVLPSLSESFCKARLDAMVCGVPVITTGVGFGREIVGVDGERGWVVPVGDAAVLAAAVRRVQTGSVDWAALRARCRTYAERHTLELWAQEIGERCARRWRWRLVDGRLVA